MICSFPFRILPLFAVALGPACLSASTARDAVAVAACDWPEPPAEVAAWVDESWGGELGANVAARRDWILDAAVQGDGAIHLCVRWSSTAQLTAAWRDQIEPSMQAWFNGWLRHLRGYGCFPFPESVHVRITGFAVKPGQESLLGWTDRTIPVYTETDPASAPPGEPKCPDSCSYFRDWSHTFAECPGGAQNHFDYSVWIGDTLPDGAVAHGGDWGLRMQQPVFTAALGSAEFAVAQRMMGHGFGVQSYDGWAGSLPPDGSVMLSARTGPTAADGWLLRRVWKEQRALRGW